METTPKPSYQEFYIDTKGKLSNAEIKQSIPSIRKRMLGFIAELFVIIACYMTLFLKYHGSSLWGALIIALVFTIAFLIYMYIVMDLLDKLDLADLLKVYDKLYDLTEKEKASSSALLRRIRWERLKAYFQESINNTGYMEALKEDAKEAAQETKKDMKITGTGIATVIIGVLSAYVGTLFGLWKTDTIENITLKAIIVVMIIASFYVVYYVMKDFHLGVANITHKQHKELSKILRELEVKARFKQD